MRGARAYFISWIPEVCTKVLLAWNVFLYTEIKSARLSLTSEVRRSSHRSLREEVISMPAKKRKAAKKPAKKVAKKRKVARKPAKKVAKKRKVAKKPAKRKAAKKRK